VLSFTYQIVDRGTHSGSAVRSGDAWQECQQRFVNLRAVWLLRHEQVGEQIGYGYKHTHEHHPTPWLLRAKDSQQHAGSKHQQGSEKQVADFDVDPSGESSASRSEEVVKCARRWFRPWFRFEFSPGCGHFLIRIEASSALFAQPAGVHHFDEQGAGPVFGIAETILQHAHDVEADIEADEIGQG
jgi:hypothetical protein